GWIMDENSNLVIWVPDEYRTSLIWRGMLLLIGCKPLEIDFANTRHGTEWARGYYEAVVSLQHLDALVT
ncbi:hypothetical protein BD311DRAFT_664181, partial [Dichomitus squalens]